MSPRSEVGWPWNRLALLGAHSLWRGGHASRIDDMFQPQGPREVVQRCFTMPTEYVSTTADSSLSRKKKSCSSRDGAKRQQERLPAERQRCHPVDRHAPMTDRCSTPVKAQKSSCTQWRSCGIPNVGSEQPQDASVTTTVDWGGWWVICAARTLAFEMA